MGNPRAGMVQPYVVIAVAMLKGGVGKTKSAMFLAQELATAHDHSVCVVDADPGTQGVTHWATALQRDYPAAGLPWDVYQHHPRYGLLAGAVRQWHDDHGSDMFVIDLPAEYPANVREAAAMADAVVVPCGTFQDELERIAPTMTELVGSARGGTPVGVLLTRVNARWKGKGQAAAVRAELDEALAVVPGARVCDTEIPHSAEVYDRFGRPIEDTGAYAGVVKELISWGIV